jgi:DNA-binding MarR family transcriptional regulator
MPASWAQVLTRSLWGTTFAPMPDKMNPSPLQTELGQRIPFRSPGHEAVVGLARTASVLERAVACGLRPWSLSLAQYNVLRILQGAPEGLPTLAIRDRMIDPAAAVTRLVDKLVQAGLVERARIGSDRRQVLCSITPRGGALLRELDPIVTAVHEQVAAALSEEELRSFNAMCDRIRATITTPDVTRDG